MLLRSFSKLLEDLEASKEELSIRGYGLSETTLEEVFLAVNSKGLSVPEHNGESFEHTALDFDEEDTPSTPLLRESGHEKLASPFSGSFSGDLRRPTRVQVLLQASSLLRLYSAEGFPETLGFLGASRILFLRQSASCQVKLQVRNKGFPT